MAIRNILINTGKASVTLNSMSPLACENGESLILKANPEPQNWIINVQKRHKNDFPESIRPDG